MKIYLLLIVHISVTLSSYDGFCEKNFFYHQVHGYGYDIHCEKLDKQTFSELSTAAVYNEIQLTIKSSTLHTTKWHIANNLPKLREIRIINSTLIDSDLFENLNDLKVLTIINSTINDNSYAGINGLLGLNKLILNNNFLSHLSFNRTIYNLEHLDLDKNKFETTTDTSPCTFPHLQQLSLRHNKLFEVTNLACLRNLITLYLDNNKIHHVNLNLPSLTTLGLSFNNLRGFKYSLGKMAQLKFLNLEGNNLDFIQTDSFKDLTSLEHLNLKGNTLSTLSDKMFALNPKLEFINLDSNKLNKINLNLSSITELLMSNNQIKSIDFIIKLKSLKKLDLSLNKIDAIPSNVFNNFTSLTFLNLSYNKIQDNIFEKSFFGLTNLVELDVSNSNIKQFKSSTYLCNLKTLNVSTNNLSNFTGFDDLHCLETLNISYNHINDVKVTSVITLKHLRIIDLEGNRLKNIDYMQILQNLPSLQVINIRNNSLTCEFLDEMIGYFKNNSVNFTVDSKLNYDKENVAGIYCKQHELLNNTESLIRGQEESNHDDSVRYNVFVILMTLTAVFAILLITLSGIRLHFKKRNCVSDTVQLLER